MRIFPVLSLCTACASTPVLAHETWLLPESFSTPSGRPVTTDLTSGMRFPAPDHAIQPDRVAHARFRLGGQEAPLTDSKRLDHSLRFQGTIPRDGLAAVWVQLHPKVIELTDEKVAEYLDEIGATAELRKAWGARKGREGWQETYTKHAKTFVSVGDGAADSSWKEPLGLALEIVPLENPCALRKGRDLPVQLLRSGKPCAHAPIGMIVEGEKDRVFKTTGADGRAVFRPGRAGKVLLFAVDLRRDKTDSRWESDFTTLTLRVERSDEEK
jgi:uncharacterized GH25 family protein